MGNAWGHIELTTSDLGKAKAFYGELFDWKMEDYPMPDGGTYTMFHPGDGAGGGMMQQPPGAPVAWTAYVIVPNVKESTDKAKSLGATVIRDVTPVPGYGSFSIIADPTGAVIGMWESNEG